MARRISALVPAVIVLAGLFFGTADAATRAERRGFFQDWLAACRADGYCSTNVYAGKRTASGDHAFQLRIGRPDGQDSYDVTFTSADEAVAVKSSLRMRVGGKSFDFAPGTGYMATRNRNEYVVLDPKVRASVLAAMRRGREVTVAFRSTGGRDVEARFSLKGLEASLKFIDPDADVTAGSRTVAAPTDETTTPEAPPAMVVEPLAPEPQPAISPPPATPPAAATVAIPPAAPESVAGSMPLPTSSESPAGPAQAVPPGAAPEASVSVSRSTAEASPAPEPPAATAEAAPAPASPGTVAEPEAPAPAPSDSFAAAGIPPDATAASPAGSGEAEERMALDEPMPTAFSCVGEEPGWHLDIDGTRATWATPAEGGVLSEVPSAGVFRQMDFLAVKTFAWHGQTLRADPLDIVAFVTAEACQSTMSDSEGMPASDYTARISVGADRLLSGCCIVGAGPKAAIPAFPIANLTAKPEDDWSRQLLDMLPAIAACLADTGGDAGFVTHAAPTKRGYVTVRTQTADGQRADCTATSDGLAIDSIVPVSGDQRLPGEGAPRFTPAGHELPSGNCFVQQQVNDKAGQQVGWLSYAGC